MNRTGASDLEISSDIVWVVGDKGSIYFSEDKGKMWKRPTKLPDDITQKTLRSVAFSSLGKGAAVGEGGYVAISTDFGRLGQPYRLAR